MTQQGATLQNYNNELVKCIEDLREKREEVNRSIAKDEEEKGTPAPRTGHRLSGAHPLCVALLCRARFQPVTL